MKEIPLTKGKVAIIDDEDYDQIKPYNWQAQYNKSTKSYYAVRVARHEGRRVTIGMHRQVINAKKGEQVDHENHDTLNNCRGNLRITTCQGNQRNRRLGAANTSGHVGVAWYGPRNKWAAHIKVNGRKLHIGYFVRLADAVIARKAAEAKHGFHENHGAIVAKFVFVSRDSSMPRIENRISLNNTSGCTGVHWHRRLKKWQAAIGVARKNIHLGYYADKADAIAARQAANIKYGFHQNNGREMVKSYAM